MRDLTEEELKLAPDWATHYYIFDDGDILFECMNECTLYSIVLGIMLDVMPCNGVCSKSKEVNRKPFDITEHEFLESDIQLAEIVGGRLRLHLMSSDLPYVDHSKKDAIAIAKALGVTAKDLRLGGCNV